MALKTLKINGLRNIERAELDNLGRFNFIYGFNGSGKTSLLEAIHLLGFARSFRTSKNQALIREGDAYATVHARLEDGTSIGLQKAKRLADQRYQINQKPVSSSAALAQQLPLHLINNDTFALLSGMPGLRRAFIDRGVFHVEPGFLACWKRSQKALKQRNTALKHGRIGRKDLLPWDRELVENAGHIDQMRRASLEVFEGVFNSLVSAHFAFDKPFRLDYKPGWDKTHSCFEEALDVAFERDLASGFSTVGPHRADIRIKIGDRLALDVLSRGEQKIVVALMQVAQSQCIGTASGKNSVFLIDDLPAELDLRHRQQLLRALYSLGSQVFITAIDRRDLLESITIFGEGASNTRPEERLKDYAWFHVEHGVITRERD